MTNESLYATDATAAETRQQWLRMSLTVLDREERKFVAHPEDYEPELREVVASALAQRQEELRLWRAAPPPPLKGISGWLTFPAIGLVIAPIKGIISLFTSMGMIRLAAPELMSDPRIWLVGLIDVAMIAATIAVAILFFKKLRIAVPFVIGLMIAFIFANGIEALLLATLFGEADQDTIEPVFRACVYGAVWIPYFLTSKRVKNTFTEGGRNSRRGAATDDSRDRNNAESVGE